MRTTFHNELIELRGLLGEMATLAAAAMRQATEAMLTADLAQAERVLAADSQLDKLRDRCEDQAQQMLALQAPVAGDLRTVLSSIYCADKLERMGDLAEHIASTSRRNHPDPLVPDELRPAFIDLGSIAAGMADRLVELLAEPVAGGFAELDEVDHEMDALHADVLRQVTAKCWPHGVRSATCLALVARFFERYADQAVSVAKRVEFVSTGKTPSHPGPPVSHP